MRGTPQLRIAVGDDPLGLAEQIARYVRGSGLRKLVFRYVVPRGIPADTTGLNLSTNALRSTEGGSSITAVSDGTPAVSGLSDYATLLPVQKIDPTAPLTGGVCARTPAIIPAIMALASQDPAGAPANCSEVTEQKLRAGIAAGGGTFNLNLHGLKLSSLKSGDFDWLNGMQTLNLNNNQLTSLPTRLFEGLNGMQMLNLRDNQLTSLPTRLFEGLNGIQTLNLGHNQLNVAANEAVRRTRNSRENPAGEQPTHVAGERHVRLDTEPDRNRPERKPARCRRAPRWHLRAADEAVGGATAGEPRHEELQTDGGCRRGQDGQRRRNRYSVGDLDRSLGVERDLRMETAQRHGRAREHGGAVGNGRCRADLHRPGAGRGDDGQVRIEVEGTRHVPGETHTSQPSEAVFTIKRLAVTGFAAASSPTTGAHFRMGETLEIAASFSDKVIVDTSGGTPQLALAIGASVGNPNRNAEYVRGSGTTELIFAYTVMRMDADNTGVSIAQNGLKAQRWSHHERLRGSGAARPRKRQQRHRPQGGLDDEPAERRRLRAHPTGAQRAGHAREGERQHRHGLLDGHDDTPHRR